MSDTALIILDYGKTSAVFTPTATKAKDDALATAGLIGRVSNPEENANAFEAQKELKRVLQLMETARETCKRPVLDLGRAIDGTAKKFTEELTQEFNRVTKLVADFQQLELAKQRAAEAERRLEEEKLQRERDAEQRRIREAAEADQRRLDKEATEARRKAQEARNQAEREEAQRLQAEIDKQRELAKAETHEQLEATHERFNIAAQSLPVSAPPRVAGQSVQEDWVVTVTDIHLLYRHHPNCVSLSALLSEIKALVKTGTIPKGVRAEKVVKASVRLGPQLKAIDV